MKKQGASALLGTTTVEPLAIGSNPVASCILARRRYKIAKREASVIAQVGVHSALQFFLQVIIKLQASTL